jgi:hypothetical protein
MRGELDLLDQFGSAHIGHDHIGEQQVHGTLPA